MKTVVAVACMLACVVPLDAQITATLDRLPDGQNMVRIRNDSSASLAAFVVTVNQVPLSDYSSHAPLVVYSDPLIDSTAKPLPVGEERVVITSGLGPVGPQGRPRCYGGCSRLEEPVAAAGILADGTPTGDAALLNRLIVRRSNVLLAVEIALEMLSDAGRRNLSRDQVIGQFKKMGDFLNRSYVPPEQRVGRDVYQAIAGKLMDLPEMEAGSPFPPTAFVAEETAMLNRQRVTLLESQPSLADAALLAR